jgi:hypothetical protein
MGEGECGGKRFEVRETKYIGKKKVYRKGKKRG